MIPMVAAPGRLAPQGSLPQMNRELADKMEMTMKVNKPYEPPRMVTLGTAALVATLGPSLSCTGFGGSASC